MEVGFSAQFMGSLIDDSPFLSCSALSNCKIMNHALTFVKVNENVLIKKISAELKSTRIAYNSPSRIARKKVLENYFPSVFHTSGWQFP